MFVCYEKCTHFKLCSSSSNRLCLWWKKKWTCCKCKQSCFLRYPVVWPCYPFSLYVYLFVLVFLDHYVVMPTGVHVNMYIGNLYGGFISYTIGPWFYAGLWALYEMSSSEITAHPKIFSTIIVVNFSASLWRKIWRYDYMMVFSNLKIRFKYGKKIYLKILIQVYGNYFPFQYSI